MDLVPYLRILHHILIVIDIRKASVISFEPEVKVYGKSGVMFGITRLSYCLSRVIRTVFLYETVHNILLFCNRSAAGIKLKIYSVILLEIILQKKISIIGLLLYLYRVSDRIRNSYSLKRFFPTVRQFVELVYQHKVVYAFLLSLLILRLLRLRCGLSNSLRLCRLIGCCLLLRLSL